MKFSNVKDFSLHSNLYKMSAVKLSSEKKYITLVKRLKILDIKEISKTGWAIQEKS